MSSQPAEPDRSTEDDAERSRGRRPFERWRKLALVGALVLFVVSVLDAAMEDFPHTITVLSLGIGWGFLAAAFGRAMLDRRNREREAEPKSQ